MGKSILIVCKNCGKDHLIKNKHSCVAIYCSQKCQNEFNRKEKIRKWLNENAEIDHRQIKRYLIESRGNKISATEAPAGLRKYFGFSDVELKTLYRPSINFSLRC